MFLCVSVYHFPCLTLPVLASISPNHPPPSHALTLNMRFESNSSKVESHPHRVIHSRAIYRTDLLPQTLAMFILTHPLTYFLVASQFFVCSSSAAFSICDGYSLQRFMFKHHGFILREFKAYIGTPII